jgi:hypothetical protein
VVSAAQAASTYASEADLLNVALFGQTAKQWRDANPTLEGNMRDSASVRLLSRRLSAPCSKAGGSSSWARAMALIGGGPELTARVCWPRSC